MSKSPRAPAAVLVVAIFAAIGAHGAVDGAKPPAQGSPAKTSNEIFRQKFVDHCSSCHGLDLAGGRAPSLFDQTLLESRTDEALHHTIDAGRPAAGMPAFNGVLSDDEIWKLILFLRTSAGAMKGKPPFVESPDDHIVDSKKQKFRLEVVASGLEVPWGMAFLPDGRLLVTERPGRLRIIENGRLLPKPVAGTPTVRVGHDAGMFDIAVHPDYRRNGWIYLSYAETLPGDAEPPPSGDASARSPSPPSMTVIVRGKLEGDRWVQTQTIFRAPPALYTSAGVHYGSRFTFDRAGHLFFSIGDRGSIAAAQDLSTPLGKIHRVNDDGSVPSDNPFVRTQGAVPTIWSYGHRNPQGFAWDPVTGLLWASEHGPGGGDEINIIERGRNYGWGVITMGRQPGIAKRAEPGMEQPIVYYTPSIAPSGIAFYSGERYPRWRNNLFVAGLAGQQLRRLEIQDRRVVAQEVLFQQFGRTRAAIVGPEGLLYVLLQSPTGGMTGLNLEASTPGMVVRLVPVD